MHGAQDGLHIVWVNMCHPPLRAVSLGHRVAEQIENIVAHPGDAAKLVIPDADREEYGWAGCDDATQALLGLAELVFELFALQVERQKWQREADARHAEKIRTIQADAVS